MTLDLRENRKALGSDFFFFFLINVTLDLRENRKALGSDF